ncbi:DoxX family membrane protein [Aliihoeflea aestuarii]|uniref:DoxX family protein n=1 Tax=Aliihoeflea aestuarii TaxID=453840 RepID=UPI0020934C44|nr:DoxX family protein [Aliihoeflea aestuarii]MCO6390933.1 DoxX family membrane protein [Aliihoeflea aestuarii]
MTDTTFTTASPKSQTLILPRLKPVYAALNDISETLLRVVIGFALMAHGWPKIQAPLGAVQMVEGIGFYPGWFWSPALATTEFVGGFLLLIGLLTRPVALAATFVLLVTVWFHWIQLEQGYSGAELSLIWAAATFLFVVRGGNKYSVDGAIGRQF